jgi:hypothetical protein
MAVLKGTSRERGGRRGIVALVLGLTTCLVSLAQANQVWFVSRDQYAQGSMPGVPDFMNLFKADAPWSKAEATIKVLAVAEDFILKSSDADLKTFFSYLKSHNIAFGLQAGVLVDTSVCHYLEGYRCVSMAATLNIIKKDGGTLAYLAMDEPLWYGHISTLTGALRESISDVAAAVAAQVTIVHQIFPDCQVGDIEPVAQTNAPADYQSEVLTWGIDYANDTGSPLAFFQADVNWTGTAYKTQLQDFSTMAHKYGIKFGVIYNDSAPASTDIEWTTQAEQNFVNLESITTQVPDQAVIQSWNALPTNDLPETQPGTLTYLVDQYAAAETVIKATRAAKAITGSLLTTAGAAVPDAPLTADETDDGTLKLVTTVSVASVVPTTAVSALIGVRANTDDCNCSGPVDVGLGTAKYLDTVTNDAHTQVIPETGGKIVLTASQSDGYNSASFPVTAGDKFTFSIPMWASYASRNSGYVTLIFLDAAGVETSSRVILPFTPGQKEVWTGVTTSSGKFTYTAPTGTTLPSLVTFSYAGASGYRFTTASF